MRSGREAERRARTTTCKQPCVGRCRMMLQCFSSATIGRFNNQDLFCSDFWLHLLYFYYRIFFLSLACLPCLLPLSYHRKSRFSQPYLVRSFMWSPSFNTMFETAPEGSHVQQSAHCCMMMGDIIQQRPVKWLMLGWWIHAAPCWPCLTFFFAFVFCLLHVMTAPPLETTYSISVILLSRGELTNM